MPRRARAAYLFVLMHGCFGYPLRALATEGGGSDYPLGYATVNPGLDPGSPGFNLLNGASLYTASRVNNGRGQSAVPGFHLTTIVNSYRLGYTIPDGILPPGWRFGIQIVQPFIYVSSTSRAGNTTNRSQTFGNVDLTVAPIALGYQHRLFEDGLLAAKVKLAITLPTGKQFTSSGSPTTRSYTAVQPQFGLQISPNRKVMAGFQAAYVVNTLNHSTGYLSGQELDIDYIAAYRILPDLEVGVNGYYYKQVTGDEQFHRPFRGGNFGRAFAIGPQVRWILPFGGLTFKWQHEMAVLNRSDGERLWLQFYMRL